MDVGTAIRSRRTRKQFGSAPVDEETVRALVDLARHAPNHHLTEPWRFRLLGPQTRAGLEEALGAKEAVKLRRAPTLLVASAVCSDDARTADEDLLAAACAVYALLLGATALGLASYWRTPLAFDDPAARRLLGLAANERLVALVHLGPTVNDPPPKGRTPVDQILECLP